ncbi:MAG TPA: hypothetical protein VIL00_09385 [Pseudonocardiaceae bacterium]
MTDRRASGAQATSRRAGLFDLRWIIALTFAIYGVVLTVLGIGFTSQADLDKAAGVNINLWTGLALLGATVFFGVWAWLRPLTVPQPVEAGASERPTDEG